jgi:putative IMPACT (imprinted ancient) family translation regulator
LIGGRDSHNHTSTHSNQSRAKKADATGFRYHHPVPKIATTAEFTVTEQRSRFVAWTEPAATLDEAKGVVRRRSREHRKARHHCWACRVCDADGRIVEQARDDGEVGKPGMKLLEQLRSRDLEGVIVVSRYFGGVKLGPAGVGRAFRAAGEGALSRL